MLSEVSKTILKQSYLKMEQGLNADNALNFLAPVTFCQSCLTCSSGSPCLNHFRSWLALFCLTRHSVPDFVQSKRAGLCWPYQWRITAAGFSRLPLQVCVNVVCKLLVQRDNFHCWGNWDGQVTFRWTWEIMCFKMFWSCEDISQIMYTIYWYMLEILHRWSLYYCKV